MGHHPHDAVHPHDGVAPVHVGRCCAWVAGRRIGCGGGAGGRNIRASLTQESEILEALRRSLPRRRAQRTASRRFALIFGAVVVSRQTQRQRGSYVARCTPCVARHAWKIPCTGAESERDIRLVTCTCLPRFRAPTRADASGPFAPNWRASAGACRRFHWGARCVGCLLVGSSNRCPTGRRPHHQSR